MERAGTTQNKIKIAVTGGIGAGKSTVMQVLKELGYPVFSCDKIYKELLLDKEFLTVLGQNFDGVIENGSLNKENLSKIVFQDKEKLALLNSLTHPEIMRRLKERTDRYAISFSEVPLLFEGGFEQEFDKVLIVTRPLKERVDAVCKRDNTNKEKVYARIQNQVDYEKINCDNAVFISNDGDINSLKRQILLFTEGL